MSFILVLVAILAVSVVVYVYIFPRWINPPQTHTTPSPPPDPTISASQETTVEPVTEPLPDPIEATERFIDAPPNYDTIYGKHANIVIFCTNQFSEKDDVIQCLLEHTHDHWPCLSQGLFGPPMCYYSCTMGDDYDECIRLSHYLYPKLRDAHLIPNLYEKMKS